MQYVAVPAAQASQQAQKAQQAGAAYGAYPGAQQPPAGGYAQLGAQYYAPPQWEHAPQQYGWQQAPQAPQPGGGYPPAVHEAAVVAQKLAPESAAYGVVTSDSGAAYSAASGSGDYAYAPPHAAGDGHPGFAQPAAPAPAPSRQPSRPGAYRPYLGPPAAGAGPSGPRGSSQASNGAPNMAVLLPGSSGRR